MRTFRMTGFSITVLAVLFFLESVRPAHAYFDPGTGSYLFQTGIALALSGIFVMRQMMGKITTVLRRHLMHKHHAMGVSNSHKHL